MNDFLAHNDFKMIWFSNILVLSVPDEDYSRNASCALNLISTFLFHRKFDMNSHPCSPGLVYTHVDNHSALKYNWASS